MSYVVMLSRKEKFTHIKIYAIISYEKQKKNVFFIELRDDNNNIEIYKYFNILIIWLSGNLLL